MTLRKLKSVDQEQMAVLKYVRLEYRTMDLLL